MIIVNGSSAAHPLLHLDPGLQFGVGLFETVWISKKACFLTEHLSRLRSGLTLLEIPNTLTESEVQTVIDEHRIQNCVLKIMITERNKIFLTRDSSYTEASYQNGLKLKTSDILRNPASPFCRIKSLNYGENFLARKKAQEAGCDDALFLNTHQQIAECSTANIFFVKNQSLFTPHLSCGLLPGVVRSWVLDHFRVTEGQFSLADLLTADAVFVTSSVGGIVPVNSIDDTVFKKERTVTDQIQQELREFYARQGWIC
jgi:4-amino-4-deoxychorismate lyase